MNTSNNATFRLCDLKPNLMFLLRRNIPSYRTCCGIFNKVFKKIPQCVSLMRDDIKIRHTFKKAFAFTLAETLIVMGIIGVVAALTIPNLNSSTADKEKVAKVMKLYQNLEDALGRAQAVYGPEDEWQSNVTVKAERIAEFLKVSKTCGTAKGKGCFTKKNPLNQRGGNTAFVNWDDVDACYKMILADGASLRICLQDMYVDIDGPQKGRNQYGGDLFRFHYDKENGVTPARETNVANYFSGIGMNNAGWIVDYGNMDYLKVDTSGKCPNGKILDGTTNTSCK